MAGSSNSSMTSNTATRAPALAFLSAFTDSSRPTGAAEMLALLDTIRSGNRHGLLQASPAIPNASLQLAKATLDAYAAQVSDEQQERVREANKKRKRQGGAGAADVLKIRKLHIDGFESGQVWQQARRIIDSTLQDSRDALQDLEENNEVGGPVVNGESKTLAFDEDGFEVGSDEELSEEEEEGSDAEDLGSDLAGEDDLEDGSEEVEDDEDLNETSELNGVYDEQDGEDIGDDSEEDEDDGEEFEEDPDGLNDGFFSLDTFNKQTQWFEAQDAKADPNTDQASDDEDIDWHADPMSAQPAASKKPKKGDEDGMPSDMEDDDDDDELGGATFGDMDLDAPEGASDEEDFEDEMEDGDDLNANDVFYKDFFAPPQRKGSKDKKPRKPKSRPSAPDDQDVERAMADVRRDLFEDESEREDSDDALSDVSAGDPRSRKSAHERREAKLAEEIRKLEAANVAKREWTMAGEAKAADRPMNSLLEQDLDFEHVGKPVPVITAAVSESIEDMIKRRILSQEFDEVIRRRPGSDEFGQPTRRGLVDVDDSKNKQSLAEIYEEQAVKDSNPDTYVSKSDEKLKKEEKEVEQMWKEVCGKLDALSSWHYRPKAAAPSLTVVSDVATISMEDAQPATAQGVSGGDQTLAPQEIYKAGKDTAEKGEVVAKSGLPVAREEMSREEKLRRRRREKERIRKSGPVGNQKPKSAKAQAKKDTLGDLRKAGVKVINKKGEVVDMDGNKAKGASAVSSGNFKL
ncbi:U3 small nucleolar ribonucleoprotein complex, subunit Mpp10 [Microdochium trichocladiopsis]|uniref:U3 small nucleolar ribonucleoprotein protein MPP10 n=1 Tax=Microdochium trichocladiopsis TaxID=1682393 RepID=A0A9P9BMB3_9PEZI|nr:U3 small nucleolar ribonucleoprotein complex, subunit Mpp10 [Microdochium trichocladiopsis]KAH7026110.1 U3 small nucleolar ribonucleoprotein complex, subunit Mpp10 [Microdochium trichocladiopsis]